MMFFRVRTMLFISVLVVWLYSWTERGSYLLSCVNLSPVTHQPFNMHNQQPAHCSASMLADEHFYNDVLLVIHFNQGGLYHRLNHWSAASRACPNIAVAGYGMEKKTITTLKEKYPWVTHWIACEALRGGRPRLSSNAYYCQAEVLEHLQRLQSTPPPPHAATAAASSSPSPPLYNGTLFVHFDVLANFTQLQRLDKQRVWQSGLWTVGTHLDAPASQVLAYEGPQSPQSWLRFGCWANWWQNNVVGQKAMRRAYSKLSPSERWRLAAHFGYTRRWISAGFSDIYYVPARFNLQFIRLARLFKDERVYLDFALASILRILTTPDQLQHMQGIQGTNIERFAQSDLQLSQDYYHQWDHTVPHAEKFLELILQKD